MSRWPHKYVIGLTGNIAVGKSVVRQMLQHLGAYTIDADGLSHQAMAPGAPAYAPTVQMFGRFLIDADGHINRAKLGTIVFNYPDALATLEHIVHPVVLQAINTLVTRAKQPVIVIEAIKLLETNLASVVDDIWVVDAAPDVQLRRLIEKRGLSVEEARRRIAVQPSQADKLQRAGRIIYNHGNVDETWRQVQAGWSDVQRVIGGVRSTSETTVTHTVTSATPPAAPSRPGQAPAWSGDPRPVNIRIRRGMPGNAEVIAAFISRFTGKPVDRMDVMMAFGQKSYLLAQDPSDRVVALIGWQVENLIMRADEFYIEQSVRGDSIINGLINAIEDAARDLQSEVGFIFLPATIPNDLVQPFLDHGYERTTLQDIRVPAWREAVHEMDAGNSRILAKKLRAERIMKPI